jgi:hypothetical protein
MELIDERTGAAAISLRRVLALQQVDHPASVVTRACRQVGTRVALRAADQPDTARSPAADVLGRLAEQAYGYRTDRGRVARRAASAGAMYPTEVLWLTRERGRWQLFVHDFTLQRSLRRDDDAEALAAMLALAPGQTALLPVAVVWRTVQRYGFRGYRYCVLDAAQVIGNISALATAAGMACSQAVIDNPEKVDRQLGLSQNELLMPVLLLGGGLERLGEIPWPGGTSDPRAGATTESLEEPPGLSPVMTRVHRLHRSSEPRADQLLDLGGLTERRTFAQALADLERRASARSFGHDPLGEHQLSALRTEVGDFLRNLPAGVRDVVDVRLVRREGTILTAEPLAPGRRNPPDRSTVDRSAEQLELIFAGQRLAATAAGYVIVGLRGGGDNPVELSSYRQGLLLAGLLSSRLYRYCVSAGVATTAVGGFDDQATAALAGGGFTPFIVQAIGNHPPAPHRDQGGANPLPIGPGLKNDQLAASWLLAGDTNSTRPGPTPHEIDPLVRLDPINHSERHLP